jgi:cobyrinic acid a,c-diamide synthase
MKGRSEFLIGATKSGSGKTLLTLGILAALARRGHDVQPFKCGPDFIDPTLHQLVVSRRSINLDIHMMGSEGCLKSYRHYAKGAGAIVTEGVMGLFDGGIASSAALAELLDVPVLLVVDVRSAAESVAAVIKGFETFNPSIRICGVICNRVGSERHKQLIGDAVNNSCSSEILGYFPRDVDFEMPSRHLGLHMGHELGYSDARMDKLVDTIEHSIDMQRLLELSQKDTFLAESETVQVKTEKVRLAVARDEAFCFYYHENFDILQSCGFELIPFSPLADTKLPENIQGVYLGGGYPELHARQLSANIEMRNSISEWAEKGGFIYGECGGFMYMTEKLTDENGENYPMAGVFDISVKMKNRLSRLGYRKVNMRTDCCLGESGRTFYGHEFHYSDIVERGHEIEHLYTFADGEGEGCIQGNALGSYIHLHFSRSIEQLNRMCNLLRMK